MQEPQRARSDEIFAIPTLVRKLPEPIRKIIGDLSDQERVLVGLQLKERTVIRSQGGEMSQEDQYQSANRRSRRPYE